MVMRSANEVKDHLTLIFPLSNVYFLTVLAAINSSDLPSLSVYSALEIDISDEENC